MPLDDPPTAEEREKIYDDRFENPASFRIQLFEHRLQQRYKKDPGDVDADIYFLECIDMEISEKERKIQQLRAELSGLKKVRDWIKPMRDDAIKEISEDRLDKLQEAVPNEFRTE